MKRLLVALLLSGAIADFSSASAQTSSNTPSRISISTGVGLLPTYYKPGEGTGLPPLSFKLGYDLNKKVCLAAFMGFSTSTSNTKSFVEAGTSYITNKTRVFGLRGEFQQEFSDRISGYSGIMLGVHHADIKEYQNQTKALVLRPENEPTPFNPNAKKGQLTYAAFVGAIFKATKRVSLYGELGYGISIANLGITIRI